MLALVTVVALSEWAVAQDEIHHFDIGEQKLTAALLQFSEQSDTLLVMQTELIADRSAPEVKGDMPAAEALEKLLEGSGLEYSVGDDGGVTVVHAEQTENLSSGKAQPTSRPMLMAQASVEQNRRATTGTVEVVNEDVDKADFHIEEIIVTGTNIRGVQNPTTPVLQFDREDIDLSGAGTIQDFLRTIPQNLSSNSIEAVNTENPFDAAGIEGGATIDLRGLGAGSTLILLDGRRLAAGGGGQFVDVSAIPVSAIERVEILTDGASAVYGSDAVGGVVNFLTKDAYEGLEVRGRYGTVTDGGLEEYLVGASGGVSWESGGGFVSVDYLDRSPLLSRERDFVDLSDSSDATPDGTLFPSEESLSLAGSVNQQLSTKLNAKTNFLYNRRDVAGLSNEGLALIREIESESFLISSQLLYDTSDSLKAELFFDYGERESGRPDEASFETSMLVVEGKLSGSLIDLPAGPLSFAVGTQFREEDFSSALSIFSAAEPRTILAGYGELLTPLVSQDNSIPLVQSLELSLAGRYEDYSDFGTAFTPKIGVFWRLFDQLSVRGTYSESFRAPPLLNLYTEQQVFFAEFPNFLFTAVTPPAQDPQLTTGFSSILAFSGGNRDLSEETAKVWSAGLDFQPKALPGLRFETTFFDVSYEDRIENIQILDAAQFATFANLVDTNPDPALLLEIAALDGQPGTDFRNSLPSGYPIEDVQLILNTGTRNLSTRDVRGLDFTISYTGETDFGSLSASLNATYILDYEFQLSDLSETVDQLNILYRPIDFRMRAMFAWAFNGWNIATIYNYTDSYRDNPDESLANKIDSFSTIDFAIVYDTSERFDGLLLDNTAIRLNVQNLFDEPPPFVRTFGGLNYDAVNATALGRFVSLNVTKSF